MRVPQEVVAAARDAFSHLGSHRTRLEVRSDTFADEPPTREAPTTGIHRTLVFGPEDNAQTDLSVRVDVRYTPTLTELSVHVLPDQLVEVEVSSPDPELRLHVRGVSPLVVATTRRGPASLLITGTDAAGRPTEWRTSWLAL